MSEHGNEMGGCGQASRELRIRRMWIETWVCWLLSHQHVVSLCLHTMSDCVCCVGAAGSCLRLLPALHLAAAWLCSPEMMPAVCEMQQEIGCLPSPPGHQAGACPAENQGAAQVEGPHLQLVAVAVGLAVRAREVHPAKTPWLSWGPWRGVPWPRSLLPFACNCRMSGSAEVRWESSKLCPSIRNCAVGNAGRGHQELCKVVGQAMEGGGARTVCTRTLSSCDPFAHRSALRAGRIVGLLRLPFPDPSGHHLCVCLGAGAERHPCIAAPSTGVCTGVQPPVLHPQSQRGLCHGRQCVFR